MSQQDKDIESKIRAVLINPELSKAIAEQVVNPNSRPKGWSRKSRVPYYKEVYATELRVAIDEMIKDRTDVYYDYEFWEERGISRNSLYLRVNQARNYLLDHLDTPDMTYAKFFELVDVERVRGVGVTIRFKPEFRDANISDFKPKKVVAREEAPRWKRDMDDFLENEDNLGETFFREHLMLDADEQEAIKASLAGLTNVIASITVSTIKLVKVPS